MKDTITPSAPVIEARDLNLVFQTNDGPVHALKDVNLTINRGEFVSFICPSGCGKTTFLRAIAALKTSTGGSLTVNGMSPAKAQQSAIDYNVFEGKVVTGLPRFTLTRGHVAIADGVVKTQEGHGQFIARPPNGAVNRALTQWKDLTAPRPVVRTGIPASGV